MKDPFEAAIDESPPESPVETEQTPEEDERAMGVRRQLKKRKTSVVAEPTADPVKMAKMKAILAQFTENQISRYESFRRSAFQKGNMKKMLQNITGNQKIDPLINIVVCGITKMFVGELVETD